jgi:hypothetical protein
VDGGHGALAIDTASAVGEKGGASGEAVDGEGQKRGSVAVAEEELGRSMKEDDEAGKW